MIKKEIITFLENLKQNNNREWFNENKSVYLSSKYIFDNYIGDFIQILSGIDSKLKSLEVKDCVFRIYKDTRFSKDKTPYKTHFGAYMSVGGRKSRLAGFYLHLEPGASFIGGGVHAPESNVLKAIRTEIFEETVTFKSLISNPEFKKHYRLYGGDVLKTAPKGFPKDWPDIDLLRNKSYAFVKEISDSELMSKDLNKNLLDYFSTLKPMNDWINRIIDEL